MAFTVTRGLVTEQGFDARSVLNGLEPVDAQEECVAGGPP